MKKLILITLILSIMAGVSGCAVQDWVEEQQNRLFPEEEKQTEENTELTEKPNVVNFGVYDFDTFNPLVTNSKTVSEAMQLVYEPLFTLDNDMRVVPVLAKDFNVSADGKTININLKENILWHDGTAFTANDVAYTMKVIMNGQTNYTHSLYDVANYSITDDYSIQINLKYSLPRYESLLTFPIVQNKTDMKAGGSYVPNGTGPFCYGTKSSVDETYFGAFDSYHDGRAKIDAMYIHNLPSYDAYMTMLEASEIDFASSETVNLSKYMPKANLQIYDYATNRLVFLGYNLQNNILSGSNTRKGIAELIDKEDIVETAVFSRGIAVSVPINPQSYLYYKEESTLESDKLTADDFLGDDNWGPNANGQYVRTVNGVEQVMLFEILANSDSDDQMAVANNIANKLKDFNISAEVISLPYDQYIARINAKNYDMFVGEIEIDDNGDLSPLVSTNGNYFGYNNESLDTLIAQLGMTRNEEEEKALFKQYCDIILNDMPFVPLYYVKGSLISTTNVKSGVDPTENFLYKNSATWSIK